MNTEQLTSKVQGAMETSREMQHRLQDQMRNFGQVADRYVHDNAWKTVAIAALAGCLLGFLMRYQRD